MSKKLTQKLKRVFFPIIKKRDGDICFFCLLMFVDEISKWNRTYHHLNKNTEDNRPENLVFAHEECNRFCEEKPDWQILSKEKLLHNEKYHQYAEEVTAHNDEDKETNVEIDTNELYLKFAKEILTDKLVGKGGNPSVEESLNFKDTANDIAYKVKEEVGHGSSITAGRALDLECASIADFEKYKEQGGKWRIKKRKK